MSGAGCGGEDKADDSDYENEDEADNSDCEGEDKADDSDENQYKENVFMALQWKEMHSDRGIIQNDIVLFIRFVTIKYNLTLIVGVSKGKTGCQQRSSGFLKEYFLISVMKSGKTRERDRGEETSGLIQDELVFNHMGKW